jgi:hypothetical protein
LPPDPTSGDDSNGNGEGNGKGKGDGDGDGDDEGEGEAGTSDVVFTVDSDTTADASHVGVSIDSVVAPVSGLDDVTDPATANAAKLGRDDAMCGTVEGPERGGAFCDESMVSGGGDATRYVDTAPGMGDAIGYANLRTMLVCDRPKVPGAERVSFASILGMIPGATLVRLAREQAQLLDRKSCQKSGQKSCPG